MWIIQRRRHVNYTAHRLKSWRQTAASTAQSPTELKQAQHGMSEGTAKLNAAGLEEDSGDDPFTSSDEIEDDETVIDDK